MLFRSLSNFGIDGLVAKKLAEIYVDHEIQSTPGGLEALKDRIQEYTKLPHDLFEAYSRYMQLTARPLYGTNKRTLEDMIDALERVEHSSNEEEFYAELNKKFDSETEAEKYLESCINSNFSIQNIEKKSSKRAPSAPFTTSSLQQEASRKLGF